MNLESDIQIISVAVVAYIFRLVISSGACFLFRLSDV